MKSPSEIVAHIERLIDAMLERPAMYAGSPASFEEVLSNLDRLRDFILETTSEYNSGYTDFCVKNGLGASTFCSRARLDGEDATFEKVAQFWQRYLVAAGRRNR